MNKKGFISFELLIYSTFILSLLAIIIGFFSYIYPAFQIQREVNLMGRAAQRNGGLTTQDIRDFKNNVKEIPIVKKSNEKIEVNAYTSPSNRSAANITQDYYISKGDREIINIEVFIPIKNPLKLLTNKEINNYTFKNNVMSEKY